MPRNMPDERRAAMELSYKEGFALRLKILFDDMKNEKNLELKVSHVFNTAVNGIFSAAVSAHKMDVSKLSPEMRQSMQKNRISIDEAKELFLTLKRSITEQFGAQSIPIMISLWEERAKHVESALSSQNDPWAPFTPEEMMKMNVSSVRE